MTAATNSGAGAFYQQNECSHRALREPAYARAAASET